MKTESFVNVFTLLSKYLSKPSPSEQHVTLGISRHRYVRTRPASPPPLKSRKRVLYALVVNGKNPLSGKAAFRAIMLRMRRWDEADDQRFRRAPQHFESALQWQSIRTCIMSLSTHTSATLARSTRQTPKHDRPIRLWAMKTMQVLEEQKQTNENNNADTAEERTKCGLFMVSACPCCAKDWPFRATNYDCRANARAPQWLQSRPNRWIVCNSPKFRDSAIGIAPFSVLSRAGMFGDGVRMHDSRVLLFWCASQNGWLTRKMDKFRCLLVQGLIWIWILSDVTDCNILDEDFQTLCSQRCPFQVRPAPSSRWMGGSEVQPFCPAAGCVIEWKRNHPTGNPSHGFLTRLFRRK